MQSTGTLRLHFLDLIITYFVLCLYPPILWPLLLLPTTSLSSPRKSPEAAQLSTCQLLSGELTRPESWMPPLNRWGYADLVLKACSLPQHMPLLSLIPSFFPPLSPLIMSSACPPRRSPPLCSSDSITFPLYLSLSSL